MFCSKCGNSVSDGEKFCSACGAPISVTADPQPSPQTASQPGNGKIKSRPVDRWAFFLQKAPQKFRIISLVALGLGMLCIILQIVAANLTINSPVYKIPLVTMMGDMIGGGDELEEAGEMYEEMYEEIEEVLEDEDLLEEFENEYNIDFDDLEDEGISLKKFAKLIKTPSINNLIQLGEAYDAAFDSSDFAVLRVLVTMICIGALIYVALTALAIYFQKTWLSILTLVLSFMYLLLVGGVFVWLLAIASYIAMAVLFSKMKLEYAIYLRENNIA